MRSGEFRPSRARARRTVAALAAAAVLWLCAGPAWSATDEGGGWAQQRQEALSAAHAALDAASAGREMPQLQAVWSRIESVDRLAQRVEQSLQEVLAFDEAAGPLEEILGTTQPADDAFMGAEQIASAFPELFSQDAGLQPIPEALARPYATFLAQASESLTWSGKRAIATDEQTAPEAVELRPSRTARAASSKRNARPAPAPVWAGR